MPIPPLPIESGQKFGRLTADRYLGRYTRGSWLCRCECGGQINARGYNLVKGITISCGCTGKELRQHAQVKHGYARKKHRMPEYQAYTGMLRRCSDAKNHRSKDYIGRGITVCDRWRHGESGLSGFECFLADLGHRPSPTHSIDRRDNDGNYEPGNCRWATKTEQGRNRRSNRRLFYAGKSITMTEATMVAGVSADAIDGRLYRGWSVEAAISTPPARRGRGAAKMRRAEEAGQICPGAP